MAKKSSKKSEKSRKKKSNPTSLIASHVDWYMRTWCERSQPDRVTFSGTDICRVSGCLLTELSRSQQSDLCAILWGRGYDASINAWGELEITGWSRK